MKILINPLPKEAPAEPLPAGLILIQQPSKEKGLLFSIFVGVALPLVPYVLLSLQSALFPRVITRTEESIPIWIIVPVLLITVLTHELLHLIWHPGGGLSDQSKVILWPQKVQFGVYYEGFMARSRWLVMRLSPLVGLSLLPTVFLFWVYFNEFDFFWRQFIVLVILVNSLGSGGDLLASMIVFRQVPAKGEIGMWNGRACWRLRS